VLFKQDVLVFLIALATRAIRPGLYFSFIDELNILNAAADIAYQGVWTWIGNPANWDILPYHSPFSTYVMTLPLLINSDPVIPRIFIAILSALTVVVMMRMVAHYFDHRTALIVGLLYAVFPQIVDWGRFVWNPNLAPLFIALWLFTLLLSYHDSKRKYHIWHWLWLSFCIQSQASLLLLAPITLLGTNIWHRSHYNIRDFMISFFAICLSITSFIPWLIGLLENWYQSDISTGLLLKFPSVDALLHQFSNAIIGLGAKYDRFTGLNDKYFWLPGQHSNWIHMLYILLVVAGIVIVLQKHRSIGRWLTLTFLLPVCLFFIDHRYGIVDHYFMASVMIGLILVAIALNEILSKSRLGGQVLFVVLFIGNLWLTASHLAWFSWLGTTQYSAVTHMDTLHHQVALWNQQAPIVFLQDELVEQDIASIAQLEWIMFWKYYEKLGWARFINTGESIPIASDGQFIATHQNSKTLSDILTDIEEIQLDQRTGITWQYGFVKPEHLAQPHILPIGEASFYGLMNIQGITIVEDGLILRWQSFQTSPAKTYIFELEINDQIIEKLSLPSYQWRVGEIIITPFVVNLDNTQDISLRLRQSSNNDYVTANDSDNTIQRIIFCIACEQNFD